MENFADEIVDLLPASCSLVSVHCCTLYAAPNARRQGDARARTLPFGAINANKMLFFRFLCAASAQCYKAITLRARI